MSEEKPSAPPEVAAGREPVPEHRATRVSPARARRWLLLTLAFSALLLLSLAVLDRLHAQRFEQGLRLVRELDLARVAVSAAQQRLGDGAPAGPAALRGALQRLGTAGQAIAAAPPALANDIAAQALALDRLADAGGNAAATEPAWAERAEVRAILEALQNEVVRVERASDAEQQALLLRQQIAYGLGWALVAVVFGWRATVITRKSRLLRGARQALRDSSARYEQMLDMLPQMVWICNADAQSDYLNQRWAEYSGQPVQQLLGGGWLALLHPEDVGRVLDQWRSAVASGADALPAFRLRRHDGQYRWFNARFGVSHNTHGQPVRWFGSSLDIDDVERAHAALAQREQFYRTTLSALSEGVITFDAEGRATGSNPAAQRMLGLDNPQIVDHRSRDWGLRLQYEDGTVMPLENTPVATVLACGRACRDVLVATLGPDDERRWLHVNAEPVFDRPGGKLVAVVSSFRDVTERKRVQLELKMHRDHLESLVADRTRELSAVLGARTRTEQLMHSLNDQLQEAERFMRLVADSIPGRLVYWDRELHCRFVNRTQCEWFDEEPYQVIGRTLLELRGQARTDAVMPRVLATLRGEEQDFERTEYSRNGARIDSRIQYIPDRRDGEVKGFVVLVTNVTRHKQAEQLLRLRNEQLVDARDRADAANQAKSTFLANMSHEIRTPMNAIIGFTHMLRREIHEPVHQQRLSKIGNAANHLLQVINDILDLSKIEAGKLVLEPVDFSLDGLLTCTCSMVVESVRDKGLELVMQVEPVPDRLHGDPTRLMQALLNLLSNAVKFTERGVVSLHVELVAQDGDTLVLRFEVRDTGIGIAEDDLAQLFNPFSQADGSSTRQHGGTGLGLAITRHIAEAMDGEAGVDSEKGQGSRFWFSARLGISASEEVVATPVLHGMRALVADDLAEARTALAEMLRGIGLRVDAVASGTEALEQSARAGDAGDPYHVVLLDSAMPGLDGIETGTRLSDAMLPPQAMVLVSVRDHASVHQLAREAGFGAVLLKPVSSSMLLDCLMRLLKNPARPGGVPEPSSAFDHLLPDGHRGARVLLAEDNPVNQEVAVQLLESTGFAVEVAADGQEAVQMARARHYDLVLMDMQMPRMDGLQATRLLRQDPAFAQLPIIAMTANAFPEDRQACLDAGMNDHLAKPVDPRLLQTTLLRWLPQQRQAAQRAGAVGAVIAAPAPQVAPALPRTPEQMLAPMAELIDLPQAYEYAAGQASILLRVMQQFVAHYEGAGEQLLQQIYASDTETPARTLHSLRGVSGMIGAAKLRAMTMQLESAVHDGRPQHELLPQAAELRAELDRLIAAIAAQLG